MIKITIQTWNLVTVVGMIVDIITTLIGIDIECIKRSQEHLTQFLLDTNIERFDNLVLDQCIWNLVNIVKIEDSIVYG